MAASSNSLVVKCQTLLIPLSASPTRIACQPDDGGGHFISLSGVITATCRQTGKIEWIWRAKCFAINPSHDHFAQFFAQDRPVGLAQRFTRLRPRRVFRTRLSSGIAFGTPPGFSEAARTLKPPRSGRLYFYLSSHRPRNQITCDDDGPYRSGFLHHPASTFTQPTHPETAPESHQTSSPVPAPPALQTPQTL